VSVYRLAIRIAALWNPKARKWIEGRKNVLEEIERKMKPGKEIIWMHCSSLGEFEQGRPVLEQIRLIYRDVFIVVSFFSPSGYEVRKDYAGADHVCYLPFGNENITRRFIRLVNPKLVIWIKYDYWYHYLKILKQQNIPVLLVSAIFREEQPFFKWYGGIHREMLSCFTHLFVQNLESKQLLEGIGITNNVTVNGDTRFDRVIDIAEAAPRLPLIEKFCGDRKVIVAGSTWPDDEEELDHYANTNPEIRFIIAPHEIHEAHLLEIEKLFKHTIRYSKLKQMDGVPFTHFDTDANTLIIDNIGMLSKLYQYATIAYVGGAFGEDGVHNVLEAAVYGTPVVFGPEYDKFQEAIDLVENGGAFSIENALELEDIFNRLFNESDLYNESRIAAKDYVYMNRGATEKILKFVAGSFT
jgi:3-deoxy-D-manno-octulosonic-acid transferase